MVVEDPDLYAPGGHVITMALAGPDAITTPTTRASLTKASLLGLRYCLDLNGCPVLSPRFNEADWVDEGAAEFMASIIDSARTGRPIDAANSSCARARNIAELEGLSVSRGDIELGCNYSLGER